LAWTSSSTTGVAGPIGTLESVDWGEWMRAIEINLFGSVLLSRAVLSHFKQAGYGKIIQLSGGGAVRPADVDAYAAEGAVSFAKRLLRDAQVPYRCQFLAPAFSTRMLSEFIALRVGELAARSRTGSAEARGRCAIVASRVMAVFLRSPTGDGITGKLLSAVWDPWEVLPEHLADLRATDHLHPASVVPADP
jgi:NAD(P)-dependent dehydrogenase (short-subunit alcohol dehydrogenase family)